MRFSLRLVLASTALMFGFAQQAGAQDEPAYMVTYIEVAHAGADEAASLLTAYASASQGDAGNRVFQALQRIGRPNHFAIVETWTSAEARDAHANSARAAGFREDIAPMLYTPIDARPHGGLHTALFANPGADAVFVVTHVDVAPPYTEVTVGLLDTLSAASRRDDGNVRFDVLVQLNRVNHMTVVETWGSVEALQAHAGVSHTKAFRGELSPMSGALYDERLYRGL